MMIPRRPNEDPSPATARRAVRAPRVALTLPWVPFGACAVFLGLVQLGGLTGAQHRPVTGAGVDLLLLMMLTCVIWWAAVYVPWRRRRDQPTTAAVLPVPGPRRPTSPTPDRAVVRTLQLILGAARSLPAERLAAANDAHRLTRARDYRPAVKTAVQALAGDERRTLAALHTMLEQLGELGPAAHGMGLAAAVQDLVPAGTYATLSAAWQAAAAPTAAATSDGTVVLGALHNGTINHTGLIPAGAPGAGRVVEAFLAWLLIARDAEPEALARLAHLHTEGTDTAYRAGLQVAWPLARAYGRAQTVRVRDLGLTAALWYPGMAVLAQDLIPEGAYLRLTAGWTAAGLALPSPFLPVDRVPVARSFEDGTWCLSCTAVRVPAGGGQPVYAAQVVSGLMRPWCASCGRPVVAVAAGAFAAQVAP